MLRLAFFSLVLGALINCSSNTPCPNSFATRLDSLVKSAGFTNEYLKDQTNSKSQLIERLCEPLKNEDRIILLDLSRQGGDIIYGLLYGYTTNKLFTYNYTDGSLDIANDGKYDKYGKLKQYVLSLKDSTVEKLMEADRNKTNFPDKQGVKVFYLDAKSKLFHYFNL